MRNKATDVAGGYILVRDNVRMGYRGYRCPWTASKGSATHTVGDRHTVWTVCVMHMRRLLVAMGKYDSC